MIDVGILREVSSNWEMDGDGNAHTAGGRRLQLRAGRAR